MRHPREEKSDAFEKENYKNKKLLSRHLISPTGQADSGSENDALSDETKGESRRSSSVYGDEGEGVDGNQTLQPFQLQQTHVSSNTTINSSSYISDGASIHDTQPGDGLTCSYAVASQLQAILPASAVSSSTGVRLGYFPCVTPQSVVIMQPQPISNGMPLLQLQDAYEAALREICVGIGTSINSTPMNYNTAAQSQRSFIHNPMIQPRPITMFPSQQAHVNVNALLNPAVSSTDNSSDANTKSVVHEVLASADVQSQFQSSNSSETNTNVNIDPTQQHQPIAVGVPPTPIVAPIPVPIQQQPLTVQDNPNRPVHYNGVNPHYPGLQVVNQNPPIFAVPNFLTSTECDFLICVAQDCFTPAPVVGKGAGEVTPSRTSSTCYLAREDLPEYLRKVSLLTGKPIDHCELPQVGRYFPSQQYLQHFDAFDLSNEDGLRFAQNGGQRTVTVLVYLNDVERGGETSFPTLNLEVKPKKGTALVFFPATVDGLLDKNALHAAKPAIDTKYVSQVWIRQSTYQGLPSKRMFSSPEQASIVQKSLICAREGGNIDFGSPTGSIHANNTNITLGGHGDSLPPVKQRT